MKVFGCKAFVHVSKELRKKLDTKGQECLWDIAKILKLQIH